MHMPARNRACMSNGGQNVRRHVRAAREDREWSQYDLAQAARVSRGTVQNLENGLRLSEGKEAKIEKALGWKIGTLDRIRNGEEPEEGTSSETITPRDDFEQQVLSSVLEWERKLYWIRQHREVSEAEDQLLREIGARHPNGATSEKQR